MSRHALAAVVLASGLITFDGTAVTVALPDIGRSLEAPMSVLQWTTNASLLVLAVFLVPAGVLGDRFGRRRVMAAGLALFGAASVGCAMAGSAGILIGARFVQGAGAALVVPGAIAILRASYRDDAERTRAFGVLAAWTGFASAAGPLLGGALVDVWSWRVVFLSSAALASAALLLLRAAPESADPSARRHLHAPTAFLLMAMLAGASYALIEAPGRLASADVIAGVVISLVAAALLVQGGRLRDVIPAEVLASRNCLAANASTFLLYFGLFGLSFLLVLYMQGPLGYSATWAGVGILPISVVLWLLAEPFGRVAGRYGSRVPIVAGPLVAGAGMIWIGAGPHPLSFWTVVVPGTAVFGAGMAIAVSALTHAAVSSLPESCAGAASGVHHGVVRTAGLLAVALLGSVATGEEGRELSITGFRVGLIVSGAVIVAAGALVGRAIRNEEPGGLAQAA